MSNAHKNNPFDALEKLFHEPNRMAIMSTLCGSDTGLSFTDLRDACGLTDGNLSRHLKALEEAGAVTITKKFVDSKPRTTVAPSASGLERFGEYLNSLATVLKKARSSVAAAAADRARAGKAAALLLSRA